MNPHFILTLSFLFLLPSCKQAKVQTELLSDRVNVDQALKMMEDDDLIVIDIRTPEEIEETGKFKGALEIDYYADDFEEQLSALDKEKKYLLYCRSGRRSLEALEFMKESNFISVFDLEGGYDSYLGENKE